MLYGLIDKALIIWHAGVSGGAFGGTAPDGGCEDDGVTGTTIVMTGSLPLGIVNDADGSW
jgi:hypothetical protein